jgi:hypothetical protein
MQRRTTTRAQCICASLTTAARCVDADFELVRVPGELGAQCWTPPASQPGWQFTGPAGLVNTAAAAWRGPRAADGTQLALLHGAAAQLTHVVDHFIPGSTYHLVWCEAAMPAARRAPLRVTLRDADGKVLRGVRPTTLRRAGAWTRREIVFCARTTTYTLAFAPGGAARDAAVCLDCVRLWCELPPAPDTFPQFIVPGHARAMTWLRRLFFLHYREARIIATFHMHWVAESVLWPALEQYEDFNQRAWSRTQLATRHLDPDGHVACHQHAGLGHPHGWPFPCWWQGPGIGWHFAPHAIGFFSPSLSDAGVGTLNGLRTSACDAEQGWRLQVAAPHATLTFPAFTTPALLASFFIIDWLVTGAPAGARCFLEWCTHAQPTFSDARRVPITLTDERPRHLQDWLDLHTHPHWDAAASVTGVRLVFENAAGADIQLFYLCSAVDTRHNHNNMLFVAAAHAYVTWCGGTTFLREQLPRLRVALRYALTEFHVEQHACVHTPWLGHEGTSGITYDDHGVKQVHHGRGIGNNYWDLLPFGGKDPLATIYLYSALQQMAELEDVAAQHPHWHMPAPPALTAARLRQVAQRLRAANTQFWDAQAGRFAPVDLTGARHDYGFTFLNCEAVHYGYATPAQAEQIMQWLEGTRTIAGDTATGADIYHWQFGPRATTRRNVDYYNYPWHAPEMIPFGGQVQDGGAVLGFAFHELMTRLRTRGADNAWQRLRALLDWFARVQAEGGYREYYHGSTNDTRGTLQGGGTAGGLGLDFEFYESVLVPQIMLYGFMGARPRVDGLQLAPRLPRAWPSLTITAVHLQGATLDLQASATRITVQITRGTTPRALYLPPGAWHLRYYGARSRTPVQRRSVIIAADDERIPISVAGSTRLVCTRRATARRQS